MNCARKLARIAVIGAGPAGLTAAYVLARKGYAVEVFEADSRVGGMAKTIGLWEQLVDLGPHRFFSSDPRVTAIWQGAIAGDYSSVNRLTRIHYRGTFFDYPLRVYNALKGLGPFEAARCVLSYFKARLFPVKDEASFQDWVSNRFGSRLFSIFFKSYSEKLWGISCTKLDADFAAQRIKKLSLYEAVKDALVGCRGTQHKTLMDRFAYPHKGAGAVYEAMAADVTAHGGIVRLSTPVDCVQPPQGLGAQPRLVLRDGSIHSFDHIISSMPVTRLVEKVGAPREVRRHAAALKFRNTILVYLLVDAPNLCPDQWIYVHSPNLRTGRITNFGKWVSSIKQGRSETIACLEYWCNDTDLLWRMPDEELVRLGTCEAYASTIVPQGAIRDGKVHRIPMSYPMYETGYREHLGPVERYLSSCGSWLTAIGRNGAFKYNNQDHSILMGLLAAENIAEGARHDLWAINTDYEYQEASQAAESSTSNRT